MRCFSSPRWPPSRGARHPGARVAPFGHPRINSLLPIPGEFRRSTRPSSPPEAKASAVCPSLVCLLPRAGRVAPPGALGLVNLDPALDCAGAISLCFSVLSRLVNELPVRGTGRPYISGDGERAGNRRPRLFQKGGVPAAPSGTATLLRLSPSHRVRPRPRLTATASRQRTSGARSSHGLTGGVYKARERIHRAMADARLLANPTSRSRVAGSDPNWEAVSGSAPRRRVASRCPPHCNTCVAPDVRAVLI